MDAQEAYERFGDTNEQFWRAVDCVCDVMRCSQAEALALPLERFMEEWERANQA